MAQEQASSQRKTPWTKIFTAFKVALDMKKLLLAAAGILAMFIGWWALSWTFFSLRVFPKWEHFENSTGDRAADWRNFQAKRKSWNLLYELAGPPSAYPSERETFGPADVAASLDEFLLLEARRQLAALALVNAKDMTVEIPSATATIKVALVPVDKHAEEALPRLAEEKLTARSVIAEEKKGDDKAEHLVHISGFAFKIDEGAFKKLKPYIDAQDVEKKATPEQAAAAEKTFQERLAVAKYKPAGLLRVMPWHENRGPNPYLVVAGMIGTKDRLTGERGELIQWLYEQTPVLLEPLFKFLMPIVYFFDARAGWLDRLYLALVLIWTLGVWGFFGGAICRIAALQVARNERIPLSEALAFSRERFLSYFFAPVFPLILVLILIFVLMLMGWLAWIPYFGEAVAGLFWPVVLLLGFIIAIVLVGLIGWPLMIATISTEGSDSFDALSRSYSYVYQAPWQYLWYSFLAVVYGIVLVFFVGFMASLMVFVGKWGTARAIGPAKLDPADDREPSFLFYYAPNSFGWRDLLIGGSPFVKDVERVSPSGALTTHKEFTATYESHLTWYNLTGAVLVSIWIYLVFLLVVGFGYSFFFSASTIIYFLMRHHVDDTDLDEVHLEEDDLEDPFARPAPAPAASPPSKPGTVSLNVVDAPPPPESTAIAPDEPPPSFSADDAPAASAGADEAPPEDNDRLSSGNA